MALLYKFYDFQEEDGSITTLSCRCRKTDNVVAVLMPKLSSKTPFLGRYLTARGFSSKKAAEIAINNYLWNRFLQLNTRFDIGVCVYPLRNHIETKQRNTVLMGKVPQTDDLFISYDQLPDQDQDLKEFHRSFEETKLNSPQHIVRIYS